MEKKKPKSVYLTPKEKEIVDKVASLYFLDSSAFIRSIILSYCALDIADRRQTYEKSKIEES